MPPLIALEQLALELVTSQQDVTSVTLRVRYAAARRLLWKLDADQRLSLLAAVVWPDDDRLQGDEA
jgi:hypothetical protein